MLEPLQRLSQASPDINQQVLSELTPLWAINSSAESAHDTFGHPHSTIYATPHEGQLPRLTCDLLRTSVAQEAGEDVVNSCCTIELEGIDIDSGDGEWRPYLAYSGPPETMARIFAGLRAATAACTTLYNPINQAS